MTDSAAIPFDETLAPKGFKAVLTSEGMCHGCHFYTPGASHYCTDTLCVPGERPDRRNVIFVKAEESQEEKHTVDPTEAPEGLIAVLRDEVENDCPTCVLYGTGKCNISLCVPYSRKDKCDVVFSEICTAPKTPDCEAIPVANMSDLLTQSAHRDDIKDALALSHPILGLDPAWPDGAPVVIVHGMEAMVSSGKKFDLGKPRLELLDRFALEQTALVLNFGAEKYAAWNWAEGIQYSRLIGSALRHIEAYNDGEDLDPESGLPHTAHAMCCLMFLLGMQRRHPEMDDRFKFVKDTKDGQ